MQFYSWSYVHRHKFLKKQLARIGDEHLSYYGCVTALCTLTEESLSIQVRLANHTAQFANMDAIWIGVMEQAIF